MELPWNLADLEIVGYANVLKETMLPSVVPPVFRLKADTERAFLPPYFFSAGFLCNATEVPKSELGELRDSREITLFDDAFPARADFELWVDRSFQRHYNPLVEAEATLRSIAAKEIKNAEDALRDGDLQEAERHSGVAISADDRRVEPLVIKAAIRRIQGNKAGEHLMAELAAPVLNESLFNTLVGQYCHCQKAVRLKPDDHEVPGNWEFVLSDETRPTAWWEEANRILWMRAESTQRPSG